MDINKQIEEALNNYDFGNDHEHANALLRMEVHRVEWLRHQQSIISKQAEEIERLTEALVWINERSVSWDGCVTKARMTLESIKE